MGASNHQTISEEYLIELLRAKDKGVMNILYEKYAHALFGVIYKKIGHQLLAEEQLQECFFKIWNNFDKYDTSKGRLFTWMLQIARNCAIDATRTKEFKNLKKIQNLETSVSIIDRTISTKPNIDSIGIRELVKQLNTKYAQIIDVVYFEGHTQAEAAEKLDLPLGTVKTRVRKALKLLKAHLL